jgi:hypothetical protein
MQAPVTVALDALHAITAYHTPMTARQPDAAPRTIDPRSGGPRPSRAPPLSAPSTPHRATTPKTTPKGKSLWTSKTGATGLEPATSGATGHFENHEDDDDRLAIALFMGVCALFGSRFRVVERSRFETFAARLLLEAFGQDMFRAQGRALTLPGDPVVASHASLRWV